MDAHKNSCVAAHMDRKILFGSPFLSGYFVTLSKIEKQNTQVFLKKKYLSILLPNMSVSYNRGMNPSWKIQKYNFFHLVESVHFCNLEIIGSSYIHAYSFEKVKKKINKIKSYVSSPHSCMQAGPKLPGQKLHGQISDVHGFQSTQSQQTWKNWSNIRNSINLSNVQNPF